MEFILKAKFKAVLSLFNGYKKLLYNVLDINFKSLVYAIPLMIFGKAFTEVVVSNIEKKPCGKRTGIQAKNITPVSRLQLRGSHLTIVLFFFNANLLKDYLSVVLKSSLANRIGLR